MSQLNGYLTALLPDPVRVLGLTLRPFSLGALNMLQRKKCTSFVDGFHKSPESIINYVSDFLTTVLVCSMTYEEMREADEQDVITLCERIVYKDKTFREFYKKAVFSSYVQRWNEEIEKACSDNSINMLQEMAKVQEYIKQSFAGPDSYPIENDKDNTFRSGAPWEQSLRDFLLTKYTVSEAMNLPLALAFWEWSKEAENNKQISIKTDDDMDAIKELKKMNKRYGI